MPVVPAWCHELVTLWLEYPTFCGTLESLFSHQSYHLYQQRAFTFLTKSGNELSGSCEG